MKKVFIALCMFMGLMMTACSPSAKSVYEKIQNKEELTDADYKAMEAWCEENKDNKDLSEDDVKMGLAFSNALAEKAIKDINKATEGSDD